MACLKQETFHCSRFSPSKLGSIVAELSILSLGTFYVASGLIFKSYLSLAKY